MLFKFEFKLKDELGIKLFKELPGLTCKLLVLFGID